MNSFKSSLTMEKLVFDKIEFNRQGFKNENALSYKMKVQTGKGDQSIYKVTLILEGQKKDEYSFLISLSGFFGIENLDDLDDKGMEDLINKNAVAILMPYLRSEVSLLTAQPDTESVVLPPFNINKMMSNGKAEN